MGTGVRFAGGLTASLASLLAAKYLEYEYLRLYAPYLSIASLIVVALVPGLIAGSFMLAFASAAAGGLTGAILWLLLLYSPSFPPLLEGLGLDSTLTFLAVLVLAFIAAGAVGRAASRIRAPVEEQAAVGTVEGEAAPVEQVQVPRGGEAGEGLLEEILEGKKPPEKPAEEGEEVFHICKYCSEPVPEGAVFCSYCGRRQR